MGYNIRTAEIRTNTIKKESVAIAPIEHLHEEPRNDKVIVYEPYNEPSGFRVIQQLEADFARYHYKITDIYSGMDWANEPCFIVGGGESLKDFDFNSLTGRRTIGINRAFEKFSPDILYSMDTRFHSWVLNLNLDNHDKSNVCEKWYTYTGYKVMLAPLSYFEFGYNRVYVIKRILDKCISRDLSAGIYGGNNSGFGAVMLAIALGANPIYLLGYDMKIEKTSHWHSGYPGQDYDNLRQKLDTYRRLMEEFAPRFQEAGVRIINLNPNSGLRCFEFDTVENVLK